MWIVEQLQTPGCVFRLFGMDDPAGMAVCQQTPVRIQREVVVPQGHVGQAGRLDLVVRYTGQARIVIEVKTTRAEAADTLKQRGDMLWAKAQPELRQYPIRLVVETEQEDYEPMVLVSYKLNSPIERGTKPGAEAWKPCHWTNILTGCEF
jgi:hypothetical protein